VRLTDLLVLPLAALWQQKLRTILTTLGVVFGAFVLAASLSIGQGVQETIDRESRRNEISRKVDVFPRWNAVDSRAEPDVQVEGTMKPERRERIRLALAQRERPDRPAMALVGLSRDRLDKLAALPHVARLIPTVRDGGLVMMGAKPEAASFFSARPDNEALRRRIVAGRYFDSPDQRAVILSELLAYRMGLVNDSDVDQSIGKPLRLEIRGRPAARGFGVTINRPRAALNAAPSKEEQAALEQLTAQLPGGLDRLHLTAEEVEVLRKAIEGEPAAEPEVHAQDYRVIGVYRASTEEEQKKAGDPYLADSAVILPDQTASEFYFRESGRREQGVNQAVLFVDDEKNVRDVLEQVAGLGLDARAAIEFIDRERFIYLMIFGGMTCVAGVALLVSALGIANTMLMSVLERTREIGIMKAVGADNRHLQLIFLVEGALIGLVGAAVGLLLAWAASFPADSWVRSMVMRDIKIDLKGPIFVLPPWIALTVLVFTILVTTLAALYPARHASRIDPVSALRHE
jgi:putative ABC transport system permease protein